MTTQPPRVVVVTRPTEYELLIAQHGTAAQAAFFLATRGRDIAELSDRHAKLVAARQHVMQAIPREWRRGSVARDDLDRFLFEDNDVVVAVGQDGLVANVARYLTGQPVVGVNPDRASYEGVLVTASPEDAPELMRLAASGEADVEERVMVEATLDDGSQVVALNELFVGHRTHQSARYRVRVCGAEVRQISSGLIVATGTGATGWARSINLERASTIALPGPGDESLAFFVRECFPASGSESGVTQCSVGAGETLVVWSEMESGGTLFGDGIESDAVPFDWGRRVEIGIGAQRLRLVRP